ncbi:hypothetical protein MLD38_005922 [Melastoma candidum]|uniref:Uncharacterized protein n=1 Tax=Melastoma candidum TaxID=119954 RepID=A0ACB9RKZ2_9MYRT|nr:hypothetical protein MLD38_005922 [Melastoma candidum]
MQGIRRHFLSDPFELQLSSSSSTATALPATPSASASSSSAGSLSIDDDEPPEARIQRLITEHPVVIFSRPSCCMCHVMKNLLSTIGVHPAVIELGDDEVPALDDGAPSVFIGGASVGGLDSLVGLHLSGRLVPRLVEVGALPVPA